jgi:hypothetical protein
LQHHRVGADRSDELECIRLVKRLEVGLFRDHLEAHACRGSRRRLVDVGVYVCRRLSGGERRVEQAAGQGGLPAVGRTDEHHHPASANQIVEQRAVEVVEHAARVGQISRCGRGAKSQEPRAKSQEPRACGDR